MSLSGTLVEAFETAKAKAIEEGKDLVNDKGEGWIDEVLDATEKVANDHEELLTDDGRSAVLAGVDVLRANKEPFLRLGNLHLAQLLAHWESDDGAEARRYYLAHKATYAERRAAMHTAGDALVDAQDAVIAAWEAVKEVLTTVGKAVLKVLGKAALKVVASQVGLAL